MQRQLTTSLAAAALVFAVSVCAEAGKASARQSSFSEDRDDRSFTVSGTIVSTRGGSLVVRIDDHGHNIPFSLGSKVSAAKLAAGSRVSVRYHPTGAAGQMADEVQVLGGPRAAGNR
jgi:hypothetical protein